MEDPNPIENLFQTNDPEKWNPYKTTVILTMLFIQLNSIQFNSIQFNSIQLVNYAIHLTGMQCAQWNIGL